MSFQGLMNVQGMMNFQDLMNFQGPNQEDDSADFMGQVTFEDFLKESLDEIPDDSQDERKESSILNKLISKGDKKERELAALKRLRDKKKNELTGAHWNGPLGRRKVVNKSKWKSNGCYPLANQRLPHPRQTFTYAALADGDVLEYDSFMPTGQVYEFLPCSPGPSGQLIGYKKYRGTHRIMSMEGAPKAGHESFMPYKLLLYRGWINDDAERDDGHRFVYLAQNKPEEPAVGDCFVRLEEIHKRMNGDSADYVADCAVAISQREILYNLHNGDNVKMAEAQAERDELIRQGRWLLRFRCWAVEGLPSVNHELLLCSRLFEDVFPQNDMYDHFKVFGVWAELLRKSQGDKLGAKDFFGRYWDAKIPDEDRQKFRDGFKIVVGAKYFQKRRAGQLNHQNMADRMTVRSEVLDGVQRAVIAPRLKFRPPIELGNIVFVDELADHGITPATLAPRFDRFGWRYLDDHPGGLYTIVVDGQVREVLYRANEGKPFWQVGYGAPTQLLAEQLNVRLDKCRPHTEPTTTLITTTLLNNVVKKRNPTQDKCVANAGYSANLALSNAYPTFHPSATVAKKKRVAEWLHRSAFSYGGHINGTANNSQTANNLVLGTPDTNTVMMRYEAFVKRLAIFSNNGQDTVTVETYIDYSALEQAGRWMGNDDHQYTWLAANLHYRYYNTNTGMIPHVDETRNLFPLNRETCLLFQSILDKSLEEKCWGWNCWDATKVVVEALLESTGVDDDQQEENKAEVKERLTQELEERDQLA